MMMMINLKIKARLHAYTRAQFHVHGYVDTVVHSINAGHYVIGNKSIKMSTDFYNFCFVGKRIYFSAKPE